MKWVQFWQVNNSGVEIVKKMNNFDNEFFAPFPKLFIQSIFYLHIHSLFCLFVCLVLFTVLSGWVTFLVLITVLSGLKDFLVKITPPWTISTSRGKFSYKGLDIKLAQCWLVQHIWLDFLYSARFGVSLTFPFHFWEKSKKPPETRRI